MIALQLPAPELSWKPAGAPHIEQPVEVKLPPILLDGGAEATDADAQKVGAYVYRLGFGGEQLWNESEQRWTAVPDDPAALPPLPLTYKPGNPRPWQGMLVAIGMKDKDGEDRFAKAAGGTPRYRLRAYARFKRDGAEYAGFSAASSELAFVSGKESQRFTVKMDPEDVQQVEEVTFLLKNASLAAAAHLKLSTVDDQAVEIATPLAAVWIAVDGSIHLKPAGGMKIVLEGNLETGQINYLSSDGVTRKNLL